MDYTFIKGQFTEAQLESAIIALFEQQGYTYVHGESIHRQYEDILLLDDLRAFMQNRYAKDGLSEVELQKIINKLALIQATPLYSGNRESFWLINEGFDLASRKVNALNGEPVVFQYRSKKNELIIITGKVMSQHPLKC